MYFMGFPDGSVVKESACNAGTAGDMGSISGLGRFPGVGNGNHSSILDWRISGESQNLRGAWWATVHAVPKNWIQLSDLAHTHACTFYTL